MQRRDDRRMTIRKEYLQATFRDVRDGLRSRAGRTALAFFAMVIGFASLAILLAVLGGLKDKSQRIVRELGIDVAGILRQRTIDAKSGAALNERHLDILARNFPDCMFSSIRYFEIPATGKDKSLTMIATDGNLAQVRQWKVSAGRFLDSWDLERRRRVAVVSSALNGRWGWKTGDLIQLSGSVFRVVGVLESGKISFADNIETSTGMFGELAVFIPKTLSKFWLLEQEGAHPLVDAIFMSVPAGRDFGRTVDAGRRLLAQPDMRAGATSWVLPDSLRAGVKVLQRTIALAGGSVSALCLVLGGLTLMSLMIANVRDRVSEIGLRRTLGAMPRDIAFMFLLEGELLAGAAAVTAVFLVFVVFLFIGPPASFPLKLNAAAAFIPLAVAVVLSAAFSYGPARAAARIMPSEALRGE